MPEYTGIGSTPLGFSRVGEPQTPSQGSPTEDTPAPLTEQDDVNIKFFNQGFRLGQIQLVSELEGELAKSAAVVTDRHTFEYGYDAAMGRVKTILEHKKQELERGEPNA